MTVKQAKDVAYGDMIELKSVPKDDPSHKGLVVQTVLKGSTVGIDYMHKGKRYGIICADDDRILVTND